MIAYLIVALALFGHNIQVLGKFEFITRERPLSIADCKMLESRNVRNFLHDGVEVFRKSMTTLEIVTNNATEVEYCPVGVDSSSRQGNIVELCSIHNNVIFMNSSYTWEKNTSGISKRRGSRPPNGLIEFSRSGVPARAFRENYSRPACDINCRAIPMVIYKELYSHANSIGFNSDILTLGFNRQPGPLHGNRGTGQGGSRIGTLLCDSEGVGGVSSKPLLKFMLSPRQPGQERGKRDDRPVWPRSKFNVAFVVLGGALVWLSFWFGRGDILRQPRWREGLSALSMVCGCVLGLWGLIHLWLG